jgi:hypothetical protein|tara:strand:+ start:362 stop:820 length:459 start_codon:yes stop_codon:yes gene_type:complete
MHQIEEIKIGRDETPRQEEINRACGRMTISIKVTVSEIHGSAFDRGSADSYHFREAAPHCDNLPGRDIKFWDNFTYMIGYAYNEFTGDCTNYKEDGHAETTLKEHRKETGSNRFHMKRETTKGTPTYTRDVSYYKYRPGQYGDTTGSEVSWQ